MRTFALAPLLALAALCALGGAATGGDAAPGADSEVLFTFVIFGDNKGGGGAMDASFGNMKKIAPSFFIGMGDHFTSRENWKGFDASMKEAFGSAEAFYARFYLTAGDNEAGALAGRQDALGAERPFYYHAGLFEKGTDRPLRKSIVDYDAKWLDYHAELCVNGVRLHLVNLYDQDSVDMQKETISFADRVCEKIRTERAGEPWVVMAHDGNWWVKSFGKGHAIYACDLLLGASWHRYECFGVQGGGTCMAFNTSAVGRDGSSWYAVMVLRDRFVVVNIDDSKFAVKGRPGCHVKPFGRPGFDGAAAGWFEKLKRYGESFKGGLGPAPGDPAGFGYRKLAALSKQFAARQGLGGLLRKLEGLVDDPDGDRAAEAKRLTAEVERYADSMRARAGAAEKDDPALAVGLYEKIGTSFSGHPHADAARSRATELKRDPKVRKELSAQAAFDRVRRAESMLKGPGGPGDPAFVRRNRARIVQIATAARSVARRYPGTKAAAEAKALYDSYAAALK